MGRRKFITKKEAEYFARHPIKFLYLISIFGISIGIVFCFLNDHYAFEIIAFSTIALIVAIGLSVPNIIKHFKSKQSDLSPKLETAEHPEESHNMPLPSVLSSLPSFLTEECIKTLYNSISKHGFKPYKKGEESYSLVSVEFNKISRIAKCNFRCNKTYRTILRYYQRNYQKFPVYSEPKTTTKTITKSIKLTNTMLENRYDIRNCSELVYDFIERILIEIDIPSIIPSWVIMNWLSQELEYAKLYYNWNEEKINAEYQEQIIEPIQSIKRLDEQIKSLEKALFPLLRKKEKVHANSKKAEKLFEKLSVLQGELDSTIYHKQETILKLQEFEKKRDSSLEQNKQILEKCRQARTNLKPQIKRLIESITADDEFILLMDFIALKYQKITGCYIIKNNENGKHYVGQSKDVYRRIKQHFKGTIPNNPVFAEDYYTTTDAVRETLFSIKVIPLQSKDELDRTEKNLIEQYDCFNSGYNGTHGNK